MDSKGKIVGETRVANEEAKNLIAFQKNMKKAELVREDYEGKFIAVFDQKVVGYASDHKRLLSKVAEYIEKPETYISYITKKKEVLLI